MSSAAAPGAMTGLRVIDLTRVLGGPYCTQILADHGADVIKVEPPAGDEVRDWGPPFHEEDAAYFVGINRNKRSIGLDLASEGGRAVLMKLLERADVLIENFKPGTLDKWGIGNDVLRAKFPRLVHCRISGFGADGPRGEPDEVRGEGLHRARIRAGCGKEQMGKDQRGGGVVEEEVVPLDRRADRARHRGSPHLHSLRYRVSLRRAADLTVADSHRHPPPVTRL